jgi:nitrite reductase/ring-hydroxylating ferredoxin subunit
MRPASFRFTVTTEGFLRVASLADVPPGTLKTVDVGGDAVTLANVDGVLYAIGAICKHADWDLVEGVLEGTKITCAGHGAIWDLLTGQAEFPEPLDSEPLYEVRVIDNAIYVRPGALTPG